MLMKMMMMMTMMMIEMATTHIFMTFLQIYTITFYLYSHPESEISASHMFNRRGNRLREIY